MHIIREKKTQNVLYMDYAPSELARSGEKIYSKFDSKYMEVGWTGETYVPAYFDIDKDGKIKELSLEEAARKDLYQIAAEQKIVKDRIQDKSKSELVKEGLLDLDSIKLEVLENFKAISFGRRRELIPDYKLENASIGVYEEVRIAVYRNTVSAFRNEYKRLEVIINDATSVKEIEAIKPNFPKELIS